MPRIRTIKPEFWQDERIGSLRRDARQLYLGLISMADDEGRFRASPVLLRSQIFPYDQDEGMNVSTWLLELEAQGRVQLYTVDGQRFGWIPKFAEHQRIDKPSKSRFPAPPEKVERPPVVLQESSTNPPRGFADRSQGEGKGREGIKEGIKDGGRDEAAPPRASTKKPKPEKPKADPRITPLTLEMTTAFLAIRGCAYKHAGAKDTQALKRILGTEGVAPEEVLLRWRRGLVTERDWYRVDSFTDLERLWNRLDRPIPEGKANGRATDADKDWSRPQATQLYADGTEGLVFR